MLLSCIISSISHTINPGNANRLKYGHEEQTHARGCIVVKELEDVHPTLFNAD